MLFIDNPIKDKIENFLYNPLNESYHQHFIDAVKQIRTELNDNPVLLNEDSPDMVEQLFVEKMSELDISLTGIDYENTRKVLDSSVNHYFTVSSSIYLTMEQGQEAYGMGNVLVKIANYLEANYKPEIHAVQNKIGSCTIS